MSLSKSPAAAGLIQAVISAGVSSLKSALGLARLQALNLKHGSKVHFTLIDQLQTPVETLQNILAAEHKKPAWIVDEFGCIIHRTIKKSKKAASGPSGEYLSCRPCTDNLDTLLASGSGRRQSVSNESMSSAGMSPQRCLQNSTGTASSTNPTRWRLSSDIC